MPNRGLSNRFRSPSRFRRGIFIGVLILLGAAASAAAAQRMAVSSTVANVRSGPGTQHEILWKVAKYHPVKIVEKSGNWYRFTDFEGDEGWLHKSLLNREKSVITTKDKCNVRSGPGTKNEVVFSVGAGIPFRVVSRKGNWIRIEHADGDLKGWIHQSLVW